MNDLNTVNTGVVTGNDDINQYFQQGEVTMGATDYNNVGVSTNPIIGENYTQYYQQSSTTENVDLNNYGTTSNDLGLNNYTTQNTGTFDLNNLNLGQTSTSNIDYNSYGIQGTTVDNTYTFSSDNQNSNITYSGQPEVVDYNTYNNTQFTSNFESSYGNPSQSYSYNYSVPVTSQTQY